MSSKSDWHPPASGTFRAKMRQLTCRIKKCGAELKEHYKFCPQCGEPTPLKELEALLEEYLQEANPFTPDNDPKKDDS